LKQHEDVFFLLLADQKSLNRKWNSQWRTT
jgi:hypothetical protein